MRLKLRYPDDTAGGILTNQLVYGSVTMRVGGARRSLKEHRDDADFAHFVYVIDSEEARRHEGVTSMHATEGPPPDPFEDELQVLKEHMRAPSRWRTTTTHKASASS